MAAHPSTHQGAYMSRDSNDDSKKRVWQNQFYEPTPEDRKRWAVEGMPPDDEIIAGFLMSNPLIWGLPSKEEIFRLADTAAETDHSFKNSGLNDYMHLRVARIPFPVMMFEMAHSPIGSTTDVVEHNYNVRLQVVTKGMVLSRIKVLHGDRTTSDPEITFDGTEFPGPAAYRQIRVVRVTVHDVGYATHEIIAETHYPRH